jgi:hypothetical protein
MKSRTGMSFEGRSLPTFEEFVADSEERIRRKSSLSSKQKAKSKPIMKKKSMCNCPHFLPSHHHHFFKKENC